MCLLLLAGYKRCESWLESFALAAEFSSTPGL
eukprot:CAMPEP_0179458576 /NCGR_PEP_ID=MMETSP0799-20121207/42110_1 /TAXON_ID=46947 /ORGANISM="Geminigera cryophila, Strain CCMP2564" /LENGTH=31 /DNA_ID= /DNA_START= /DNA_END= /DNA_ORIENTATION=